MTGVAALMLSPLAMAEPVIDITGLVEVEAVSAEDYSGINTNDITLATAWLAIDTEVNERVSTHVAFLYEEDATDLGLDEGTLTLGLSKSMSLTAGKMYVPFGRFDTLMVSDPQTLAIAETVESVLMLSGERNGLYGSAYLFNGDSDEASEVAKGENTGISGGVNLGYTKEDVYDLGISYISNIADSDALQELDDGNAAKPVHTHGVVKSSVPGMSAYIYFDLGRFTLLGEHVSAIETFSNGDLDGTVNNKEQPSAKNLEVGVGLTPNLTFAVAYQSTREAQFIGLPEMVLSSTLAYEVAEGATIAAELANMKDYGVSDGGTGENASSVTVQLAVEF